MEGSTFVRARRPEQKALRRAAILDAARRLALQRGVRAVSLGEVATAAGLAKSNVATYFRTREEIYLELLLAEMRGWAQDVATRAAAGATPVDALTTTIADRPLLCDLVGNLPTSLEHNVSAETARAFKLAMVRMNRAIAQTVATDELTDQETVELVAFTTITAGSLHAISHPPPVLADIYASEPELAAACPPFLPTLRRAMAAFAAGVRTLR